MNEVWKPVKGYEGLYEVSNTEKLRSIEILGIGIGKGKFRYSKNLKPLITTKVRYTLCENGKHKKIMFHIIVAQAFPEICGEWFEGCEVHHKDRNPLNNKPQNLICLTKEEHLKEHHKERVLRGKNAFKEKHHTEKTKEIIRLKKSKPIIQYTLDGIFVKEWLSCTECEKQTGYDKASINRCCLDKQKQAYGFIWKYKEAA